MTLKIVSTNIINKSDGTVKELLVQYMGEKLSFIEYVSGTVKMDASFVDSGDLDKEKELLRMFKQEFFPEPFNEDLINGVELKVAELETKSTQMVSSIEMSSRVLEEANKNIGKIFKQILKSDVSEDDYQDIIAIYPEWETETDYKVGDFVNYNLKAWEVVQAHASQSDWTPETVPALFKEITPKTVVDPDGSEVEIVADFIQPSGAHDAYKVGEKVSFGGAVYISKIDANTYSPTDYQAGWEKQV